MMRVFAPVVAQVSATLASWRWPCSRGLSRAVRDGTDGLHRVRSRFPADGRAWLDDLEGRL
jgi:hypothetical protein